MQNIARDARGHENVVLASEITRVLLALCAFFLALTALRPTVLIRVPATSDAGTENPENV